MNDSSQKNNAYYRSLARNISLTVILVSMTPMILISALILYQYRISHDEKVESHLVQLVQKHRRDIDIFLKERLGDIQILAENFTYEELSDTGFLQDRLQALQKFYNNAFVDLGVVNKDGLQVAYAGPYRLGQALYSEAPWFHLAKTQPYVISDVFLGLRGLPHFIIAVKQSWKGDPWILRATIDFVAFNTLVQNVKIGLTGFAFILNKNGEFQTTPHGNIVSSMHPYPEYLLAATSTKDRVHVFRGLQPGNNENIYAAAMLKDGQWLLVCQQPVNEAFSDFLKAVKLTIVLVVLGGLCIITMAVFVSRRMVNRIAQADMEKQMMNQQIVETGKLASVGELAAGIAHEINNPVAIMVEEAGWMEDLLEEEDFRKSSNFDEFKRALAQIKTQGKRCKAITHKLLSFARKTDTTLEEVQVGQVIEELVVLSAQRAKYSNVKITTDIQNNLPSLHISQSELEQVLLNLINNALDAMEKEGGNLALRARVEENFIVLEVSDDGPGIPQANLARIFDPFFTTKPVGKGTGLGLSICYGIIKKMGGEITARSCVGKGTTFRISIPCSQ
jgi:two-component system NtrC family sensor kinase